MTNPSNSAPVHKEPRPVSDGRKSVAGRVLDGTHSDRKPVGPVTYKLEKGANVWPGRK
jgi:hypothetical protein